MRRARVLIVDDERASRAVIASALDGLELDVVECASAEEALAAVTDAPDAIVLDLMMPGIDGIELCRMLRGAVATRDVPILMLTAHTGREQKLSALEAGVDDFLAKPLDRLELRTRIAAICRLNRYRRVLEERQRLDSLVSLSPNGVLVVDGMSGCVRFANDRAGEMFGAPLEGRTLGEVLGDQATDTVSRFFAQARSRTDLIPQMEPWTLNHGAYECTVAGGIVDWMGEPAMQLVITDITALRRFEQEVHRLERMETTVRLSASVAHDFATVLQICLVHLRTLSGPAARDASEAAISEMHAAIRRGTQITRDLLSFSRRGIERPGGDCDAAAVATDLSRMLDALLPRTITLALTVPEVPCRVGIADYQLEQALVNLATNARDAMEGKGALTMTVAPSAETAEWVEVTVCDTGAGIEPRVLARLGEPFVSTKAEGQGTGLGLWSVMRMVEGAGGRCVFESAPGQGTTVRLHLPPPPAIEVSALRAV
jgi:two-component system cell cycle sensor histidine kinase/response regulator CckA